MTRYSFFLAFFIGLLSPDLSANDKYTGMISSTIVEPNGHVYTGDDGFKNEVVFEDKQVIYFSQERGQKLTKTKQNIIFDSSRDTRYHLVLEMLERKGDKFKARVKFFQNAMGENDAGVASSALISREIKNTEIEGLLNADNRYVFIDDDKANLKLSINIDRIFTKQEIMQRLKRQLEEATKAKERKIKS